jgi:RNA polymerase sigma-70 factor (ECF subfamily)
VFTIARNEVNAHLRSLDSRGDVAVEDLHEQACDSPTPENALISRETQTELLAALEHLNERERDILGLKFNARFTNRQIASMTGLSESNVGVVIYRSIHKLRKKMRQADGVV